LARRSILLATYRTDQARQHVCTALHEHAAKRHFTAGGHHPQTASARTWSYSPLNRTIESATAWASSRGAKNRRSVMAGPALAVKPAPGIFTTAAEDHWAGRTAAYVRQSTCAVRLRQRAAPDHQNSLSLLSKAQLVRELQARTWALRQPEPFEHFGPPPSCSACSAQRQRSLPLAGSTLCNSWPSDSSYIKVANGCRMKTSMQACAGPKKGKAGNGWGAGRRATGHTQWGSIPAQPCAHPEEGIKNRTGCKD